MDGEADIRAMATRFFDAIEAGDIETMRESFAPGAEIWHNTDETIVTRDQTAATLTGMVARIRGREYADRRLTVFPGGFVQQHVLKG
ncbi:nuclear transport factor 2 family protein [Sphingopyxis sp. PET50]|uniref:nuclear transport factor 2 family protein n=1 Tax=Sphingopyxis sp. PET50 TaxID=2976533 RepID=UPI0021AF032A|nr:nuclear transport factor 2 family protein [Sphingopyxis sp. PET50]